VLDDYTDRERIAAMAMASGQASRRRARLAELDIEIAAIRGQRAEVAAELGRTGDVLADLGRAQRELPRTAPVAAALTEVANVAARLSAARERLDAAIAELDARARRLRRAGADHDETVTDQLLTELTDERFRDRDERHW
jgi:septal ring factor EnvC (AmiA/AmiB activator)